MSFLVQTTCNNGYFCCCHQSWELDPKWYDTLEEALSELPTDSVPLETESITITDGRTGKVVAQGKHLSIRVERGSPLYECWSGHVQGESFEVATGIRSEGKSWKEVQAMVLRERSQKNHEQAKRQLEAAQRQVDSLNAGATGSPKNRN